MPPVAQLDPIGHDMHDDCPVADWYVLMAHKAHDDRATTDDIEPAAQASQPVDPAELLKYPIAHARHDDASHVEEGP